MSHLFPSWPTSLPMDTMPPELLVTILQQASRSSLDFGRTARAISRVSCSFRNSILATLYETVPITLHRGKRCLKTLEWIVEKMNDPANPSKMRHLWIESKRGEPEGLTADAFLPLLGQLGEAVHDHLHSLAFINLEELGRYAGLAEHLVFSFTWPSLRHLTVRTTSPNPKNGLYIQPSSFPSLSKLWLIDMWALGWLPDAQAYAILHSTGASTIYTKPPQLEHVRITSSSPSDEPIWIQLIESSFSPRNKWALTQTWKSLEFHLCPFPLDIEGMSFLGYLRAQPSKSKDGELPQTRLTWQPSTDVEDIPGFFDGYLFCGDLKRDWIEEVYEGWESGEWKEMRGLKLGEQRESVKASTFSTTDSSHSRVSLLKFYLVDL
ncbi:hypothetical protein DL96DRAFT_816520 [Flagelloscypha sp. PMI_526]|nr:hypothetical protein DL96DRAFT_816520 [Flagelloscypha sp. PMI_526]